MSSDSKHHKTYLGSLQPKGFPALPPGWFSEWETFEGVVSPNIQGAADRKAPGLFSVVHQAETWRTGRVLVIIHGLFEHGGRYLHFPHYLQDTVDAVCCLDLRGHGRSEGLRGHVEEFDFLTDDVLLYLQRLEKTLPKNSPRLEFHLFGHSLGGLITLRALTRDRNLPLRSVSVSAPLLRIAVEVPFAKRLAAGILSRFWGNLHLLSELDPRHLSHDQEVADAYSADRLVHQKLTPRFFSELQRAMSETQRAASLAKLSKVSTAIQVLAPLGDQIVDVRTVQKFYRDLRVSDKELKTYPDFFHEAFNEIGKEKVFEDLCTWIISHSANS
ncbi:MAG TPA: hypothetical protein DCS07_06970 [Bdellovibrionales bacterium]|nr:MAG: hypothetical protein A2Z97_10515 [Bdellovibrionales bacterium GWB1_52_6]OFZ06018.1 MAG: hypothetical protein A2X97_01635 [Bdellovibrionales bacterium GWA1_52_35]OFZ39858.1 MAG: hypothetical protein A2070_03380 [Bdellovibrionales bacterium GWC1_52_8]HAR42360.1 hypothetical protein [Bdellovibrionales bacterium]HCM39357.1 hypothetical protein [Bdellovibrionales bacterium]